MFRLLGKLKKDNNGSTMVEVMVGFIILTVVLAEILVHVIKFSSNMIAESKDAQIEREQLKEEICKKNSFGKQGFGNSVNVYLTIREEEGQTLTKEEKKIEIELVDAALLKCESKTTGYSVFNINYEGK